MDETVIELINRRRRQILVHSAIYYQFNDNLITDHTYDHWSKELAELQVNYPKESKTAPFYEEFKTFDGSTGFDLPKNEWAINKAMQLLRHRHEKNK